MLYAAGSVCLRDPFRAHAAPCEHVEDARSSVRQQSRSSSAFTSAPFVFWGALRGVPADGVAGDSKAAPAQGKAFPSNKSRISPINRQWNGALHPICTLPNIYPNKRPQAEQMTERILKIEFAILMIVFQASIIGWPL